MKRALFALLVCLLAAAPARAQRPPLTILSEIETLTAELRAALQPTEPLPPPEAVVATAAELDAALANGGDIRLQPGVYVGNPVITVPGTRLLGVTGLHDGRVAPSDVAAVSLVPADPYQPTLRVRASDVLVHGLTVNLGKNDRTAVEVGRHDATTVEAQPARVVLDQIAVLAGSGGGLRGIALHGVDLTVRRSYVSNFWYRYRDSQAVWLNNGPGPYTIEDNYLEGSGENIMAGGAEIYIPDVVPGTITIRGNTIYKPEEWRTLTGSVKNSVEFKAARGALVEGNTIIGNWRDAQGGDVIVLTPRNPSGRNPWIVVEDVTIRGNTVMRVTDGHVIAIQGTDNNAVTQQTARVTVEHNLFMSPRGLKVLGGVADALIVRRNTLPDVRHSFLLFASPTLLTPITVTGNVARGGDYGIVGTTTVGEPSLLAACTVVDFTGNLIEKDDTRTIRWPAGNTLVAYDTLLPLLDPVTLKHPDPSLGY